MKVLRKIGFTVIGQAGSHIKLRKNIKNERQMVIVPNHRSVRKGTFHNIMRLARLSVDEFIDLLKK